MATLKYFDEENHVSVYRADKYDVNGNPRVIVHFLDFLGEKERENRDVLTLFDIVQKRLKGSGWRKFHNKEFGGGFVRQFVCASYQDVVKDVIKYRN